MNISWSPWFFFYTCLTSQGILRKQPLSSPSARFYLGQRGQKLLIKQAPLSHVNGNQPLKKQLKKHSFMHDKPHRVVRVEIKRRTRVSKNKWLNLLHIAAIFLRWLKSAKISTQRKRKEKARRWAGGVPERLLSENCIRGWD